MCGFRLTSTRFTGTPQAIALDSSGNIITVGTDGSDFAIMILSSSGGVDTGFNTTGECTIDFDGGYDIANAVVIAADGDIIAGGYATNGSLLDAATVALNPSDGSIDTASGFGTSGMVDIDDQLLSSISALAVDDTIVEKRRLGQIFCRRQAQAGTHTAPARSPDQAQSGIRGGRSGLPRRGLRSGPASG